MPASDSIKDKEIKYLKARIAGTEKTLEEVREFIRDMLKDAKK